MVLVNKQEAHQSKKHRQLHLFSTVGLKRQIGIFWQSMEEDWTFPPSCLQQSSCEILLNDLLSKSSIVIAAFTRPR